MPLDAAEKPCPYEALGVPHDASEQDIRKKYRRLAKKIHPDLNGGTDAAKQAFQIIGGAYDIIGDPEKRKLYDQGGHAALERNGAAPAWPSPMDFFANLARDFAFAQKARPHRDMDLDERVQVFNAAPSPFEYSLAYQADQLLQAIEENPGLAAEMLPRLKPENLFQSISLKRELFKLQPDLYIDHMLDFTLKGHRAGMDFIIMPYLMSRAAYAKDLQEMRAHRPEGQPSRASRPGKAPRLMAIAVQTSRAGIARDALQL